MRADRLPRQRERQLLIGLATQRDLQTWEVDDRPLHAALTERGCSLAFPIWDEEEDWSRFDAVVIRTTWDYMDRREDYVAWAERVEQHTRLFNPAHVIRWNTHKGYLAELAAHGVPIAPTVWMERGTTIDVATTMTANGWYRGFIKPMVGATARETLRFDADTAGIATAQDWLDRTLANEDMMLQPYLERVEVIGERSLIFLDGQISHGVRKVPVGGDYRVQDDFGAYDEPWTFPENEMKLACEIVATAERQLGLAEPLLYARVDFLEDDDGQPLLTELELVEPSLFFRHAPDAPARLADAIMGRLKPPVP